MSRWLEETGGSRGSTYDEQFRALEEQGVAVHGEADFVTGLVPGGRVLDAGCGTGRLAIELARRGYDVVGVDSDASMLDVARTRAPQLPWHLLDLTALDEPLAYDAVVAAGNVMVYVAEGTGAAVLATMARALRPGGLLVSGWRTERAPEDGRPMLAVATYDAWAAGAGLTQVARYATWDGAALTAASDWCVAVDRRD